MHCPKRSAGQFIHGLLHLLVSAAPAIDRGCRASVASLKQGQTGSAG